MKPTRPFLARGREILPCAACGNRFVPGEITTLMPLGPGNDPEAQTLAQAGRPYNAVAVLLHWTCAGGDAEEGKAIFDKMFPGAREAQEPTP